MELMPTVKLGPRTRLLKEFVKMGDEMRASRVVQALQSKRGEGFVVEQSTLFEHY